VSPAKVEKEGPVVVNAGPLIALSVSGHLQLLQQLYGEVLVPEKVFREVTDAGAGKPGAAEVAAADFLVRTQVKTESEILLVAELGPGEAEVITLAMSVGARFALLDDRRARRVAEHAFGLRVRGTAGLLVEAKRAGAIASVRPIFEGMVASGYYLSQRLIERACREVGE
jgi:hypothetical protein